MTPELRIPEEEMVEGEQRGSSSGQWWRMMGALVIGMVWQPRLKKCEPVPLNHTVL